MQTPSLYHHFRNKDELLSEVSRLLLIEGPLPEIREGLDWRDEIVGIGIVTWRSVLRHPNAAPLLLQFFPRTLLMGAYEHWMHLLTSCGVPASWHLRILDGAEKLTFGSALFAASAKVRGARSFSEVDLTRHPHIHAAIEANALDDEEIFVLALRSYLNGLPL